jgi:hypothetical protein
MGKGIFAVTKRKTVNTFNDVNKYIKKNHIARKAHNTMKEINSVAMPGLAAASVFQPELAPVFGGVASALKGTEAATGIAKKHFV